MLRYVHHIVPNLVGTMLLVNGLHYLLNTAFGAKEGLALGHFYI